MGGNCGAYGYNYYELIVGRRDIGVWAKMHAHWSFACIYMEDLTASDLTTLEAQDSPELALYKHIGFVNTSRVLIQAFSANLSE